MTERIHTSTGLNDIPAALVRRSGLSMVWLIPFIAAVVGVWLGYKALSEQGSTVIIEFKSAEGLEAGKTKIRYKNVEVGQVRSVELAPTLSKVMVSADMVKGAERYLTEKTRFWIVHARVSGGQISGLGTLFSGAYIGIDPVLEGPPSSHFVGLDVPPAVTTEDPGRYFILRAESLASLDIGSPVFYRKIQVGDVVDHRLNDKGNAVEIRIFVRDPYHQFIHKNTRFWNAAGIDMTMDANGVRINTESLASILIGGVAFETPDNLEAGGLAAPNTEFHLYPRHEDINDPLYVQKTYWLLNFTGSVRGLAIDAPVEFRGIRVGKVKDFRLNVDVTADDIRIPVLIEIEPGRLGELNQGRTMEAGEDLIDRLVVKGLRAQLKTGNLITGQVFVDLDMFPKEPTLTVVRRDAFPELPTMPTPLEELKTTLMQLLDRVEKIPFEALGVDLRAAISDLRGTLKHTSDVAEKMNDEITPTLKKTLDQAQTTLRSVEAAMQPDSTAQTQLKLTLKEISDAARSLRQLTDYLERHPESLIKGKSETQSK